MALRCGVWPRGRGASFDSRPLSAERCRLCVPSAMETTGCSLEQALACARANGLAEADPSADLDGDDAAAKLAILCALAFGLRVEPSQIETRSSADTTIDDL